MSFILCLVHQLLLNWDVLFRLYLCIWTTSMLRKISGMCIWCYSRSLWFRLKHLNINDSLIIWHCINLLFTRLQWFNIFFKTLTLSLLKIYYVITSLWPCGLCLIIILWILFKNWIYLVTNTHLFIGKMQVILLYFLLIGIFIAIFYSAPTFRSYFNLIV